MSNTLYHHRKNPHMSRNANEIHKEEQRTAGFNTRLAVTLTRGFGTVWAFYILIAWMFGWMILASAGVWLFGLDRYPFSFLLFLSNLVQLFALPVIMVGQAVLSRKQELQADEQFTTTQKDDHNIEQMMQHLTAQDEELLKHTELLEQLMQQAQTTWKPLPVPFDFGKDHHTTPRTFPYPIGEPTVPLDPEAYKKAAYPPPVPEPTTENSKPEPDEKALGRPSPIDNPAKRYRKPRTKRDETKK